VPITSLFHLLILAAIWGFSFLFTRIAVPDLGAVVLVEYRVCLAAVFLFAVAMIMRKRLDVRQHWRYYLVLGIFNAALPFMLFSFAAMTLSASALSILNATTPIWGAVVGAVWMRQPLVGRTVIGLTMGVAGVGFVVGLDHWTAQAGAVGAIVAALTATLCYGIATNYAKQATAVDSFSNAHGSMWAASLFLLPAIPFVNVSSTPDTGVILAVLALGVICTGIGFLLFFRLVRDIGSTSTLTVTFLIPVFGMLWGHLFLDEVITPVMMAGSLIVIMGTVLATGFDLAALRKKAHVS
jgi:drug/metabolite transporter (DMT)-like permease